MENNKYSILWNNKEVKLTDREFKDNLYLKYKTIEDEIWHELKKIKLLKEKIDDRNQSIKEKNITIFFNSVKNSGTKINLFDKRFQIKTNVLLKKIGINFFVPDYSINFISVFPISEFKNLYIISQNSWEFIVPSEFNKNKKISKTYSSYWIPDFKQFKQFLFSSKEIDYISRGKRIFYITTDFDAFKSKIINILFDEQDPLRQLVDLTGPAEILMKKIRNNEISDLINDIKFSNPQIDNDNDLFNLIMQEEII